MQTWPVMWQEQLSLTSCKWLVALRQKHQKDFVVDSTLWIFERALKKFFFTVYMQQTIFLDAFNVADVVNFPVSLTVSHSILPYSAAAEEEGMLAAC